MPFSSETLVDLAGALGILVLAVPALSLNARKKQLARISGLVARRRQRRAETVLDEIAAGLETDATQRANRWRRVDEICLYVGYVLLLGSAVTRVFT